MNAIRLVILLVAILTLLPGCMRYLTQDRREVLIDAIDIDQTLQVAAMTLNEKSRIGSVLTLWAIRDQKLTAKQARIISRLYFKHVFSLTASFDVWHLTWALCNMDRLGIAAVKVRHLVCERFGERSPRALSKSGDLRPNVHARLVGGLLLAVFVYSLVARPDPRHHRLFPEKLGRRESREDLDSLLLGFGREPADGLFKGYDVAAVVVPRRREKRDPVNGS